MDEKKEDRFHNTKYLLKQYRRVVYSVMMSEAEFCSRVSNEYGTEMSPFEVNAELAGIDLSNTKLESYAKSVAKSKMMLNVLDNALNLLRSDPENGELMYQILFLTYFTPQKPRNVEEIMQLLFRQGFQFSQATYFNYLIAAIKAYDTILWGYTSNETMTALQDLFNEKSTL